MTTEQVMLSGFFKYEDEPICFFNQLRGVKLARNTCKDYCWTCSVDAVD